MNPSEPNQIGQSNAFLAYPEPTDHWNLTIGEDACTPINYHAVFSWDDLMSCEDADGRKLVDLEDDGTTIVVSGTFYASVVSPHTMGETDSGYYRVYPLVQQDWELTIVKQVNVLSSTNTQLFIVSILSIFEDATDGSFRMIVFTQSADYIKLSDPILISTPFASPNITMMTADGACISASRYTCGQLFEVTVESDEFGECPPADFTGQYQLGFKVNCETVGSDVCATFIDDNGGDTIALDVYSNFVDNTCDPQLYTSILTGTMTFYDDPEYTVVHNDSDPYVIGQDTVYVEAEVIYPDTPPPDNYDVFKTDLVNVFVCTTPSADESNLETNLDQQSGLGGCFSRCVHLFIQMVLLLAFVFIYSVMWTVMVYIQSLQTVQLILITKDTFILMESPMSFSFHSRHSIQEEKRYLSMSKLCCN